LHLSANLFELKEVQSAFNENFEYKDLTLLNNDKEPVNLKAMLSEMGS
jgi:hypothetical protein